MLDISKSMVYNENSNILTHLFYNSYKKVSIG